jgi:aryl-alcohol dehydrogenase-like predicted oxidoreductase
VKYRSISADKVIVSTLAVGGNIFGYACDQRETKEILDAASDNGINFIDTADVYSDGQSEQLIGNALRGKRESWIIASKVGVKSNQTGRFLGSKKEILTRIEHSLRRLQTDYIDIYQLHQFDPETPVFETLEAMETLRNQGKLRYFGISNFNLQQVDLVVQTALQSGFQVPVTNQIHYNILKRKVANTFFNDSEFEWPRLLIYGALGRGVLSGKYRLGEAPSPNTRAYVSAAVKSDLRASVLQLVSDLTEISRQLGITMSQLAISYVLRSNKVAAALVGVRSVEQLLEVSEGWGQDQSPDLWVTVDKYLNELEDIDQGNLGEQLFSYPMY